MQNLNKIVSRTQPIYGAAAADEDVVAAAEKDVVDAVVVMVVVAAAAAEAVAGSGNWKNRRVVSNVACATSPTGLPTHCATISSTYGRNAGSF